MVRHRILSSLAAAFTGVCVGVVTFLLLGLLSERVPKAWEHVIIGDRAQPALGLSLLALVAAAVFAYRWAAARNAASNEGRWFAGAVAGSVAAGAGGRAVLAIAHEALPRRWFSRGGDWDFDPGLEMVAFGAMCMIAAFWLVYRRALSPAGA